MISLREAQLGNPQSFISEQEAALGQQGDLDRLNQLIGTPYRDKSKEAQEASLPHSDGDCSGTHTP